MTVYMVRRKSDGLFSNGSEGGYNTVFAETGKIWFRRDLALNHYRRMTTPSKPDSHGYYRSGYWKGQLEVVEFSLTENTIIAGE